MGNAVDLVSDTICAYVVDQRTGQVSDAVLHAATRRVLDSLACAVAAMDSVPARIVRGIAGSPEVSTVDAPHRSIGLARPSTMDLAAFLFTVMILLPGLQRHGTELHGQGRGAAIPAT